MRILKSRRIMLLLVMLLLVALLGAAGVVSAAPTVTNVTAQLNPDYKIVVDGVNQNLFNSTGQPVYPLVYNNSTYLPLRAMGELMNKNVNWDEANLTASLEGKRTAAPSSGRVTSASRQYVTAQLRPDFTIMMDGVRRSFTNSDGTAIYPLLYNGSVYLPLRSIGELMGKNVDWDGRTSTISIYGGTGSGNTVTDADSFNSNTSNKPVNPGTTNPGSNNNGVMLTLDEARAVALRIVSGASASDITKLKLDYDDGRPVYEVELLYNFVEYELELDAYTGATLKMETENKAGQIVQPGQSNQNPNQSQVMSNDDARAAALRAVPGSSLNNITKLKLEYDDDRWVYDVEIYYNFVKYELELDAYTGQVLDMQAERQDYFYNQAHRVAQQAVSVSSQTVYCAQNCVLNHTHYYQTDYCPQNCSLNHTHCYQTADGYCPQNCTLSHTHHYQSGYCAQNCFLNHTHHYASQAVGGHHGRHHR